MIELTEERETRAVHYCGFRLEPYPGHPGIWLNKCETAGLVSQEYIDKLLAQADYRECVEARHVWIVQKGEEDPDKGQAAIKLVSESGESFHDLEYVAFFIGADNIKIAGEYPALVKRGDDYFAISGYSGYEEFDW